MGNQRHRQPETRGGVGVALDQVRIAGYPLLGGLRPDRLDGADHLGQGNLGAQREALPASKLLCSVTDLTDDLQLLAVVRELGDQGSLGTEGGRGLLGDGFRDLGRR